MARIHFLSDDIEVEVSDGTPIRDAAGEADASLPFGCYEGFCGTCTLRVIEGYENLNPPNENERERIGDDVMKAQHKRLGCQAVILKGRVVVENDW